MAVSATPIQPAVEAPELPPETRLRLFHLMLLQRYAEERIMTLYKQGRIAGSVYTGYMQEAVAAASGLALGPDDVVAPLNREQACHYARGITTADVFRNFLGRGSSPTRGRDGNMHFGRPEIGVFPLVSMLGDLVTLTTGAALAFKRRGEKRVAMTFIGDGQFCVGDVHEGLNLAGVLHVPAVFVLQNNQFAYSTPTGREMLNPSMADRVRGGWSIPAETVDGTDAFATHIAVRAAVERARSGEGPQAVEAITIRGHGHAAHDDARYVSPELRARFQDPIERVAARLVLDGLTEQEVADLRGHALAEVNAGLAEAEQAPPPDPGAIEDGVYAMPVRR